MWKPSKENGEALKVSLSEKILSDIKKNGLIDEFQHIMSTLLIKKMVFITTIQLYKLFQGRRILF